MSFTFEVCKTGDEGYQVSGTTGKGSSRNTTQSFSQTYLVKAIGSDGQLLKDNLLQVAAAQAGLAEGLPIVQRTVYRNDDAGVFHPYAVCMNKDVKRRKDQPALFDVTCTFKTTSMETEFVGTDQVQSPEDLSPEVVVSTGEDEVVLYSDVLGDQCYRNPGTKEWFQRPVTAKYPVLTLTVTQYEKYISYADIQNRSYRTNEKPFQGFDMDFWVIVVKNVSEVVIPTASGDQEWAKVTYEIKLSGQKYYRMDIDDQGTIVAGDLTPVGWVDLVPGISSKYRHENKTKRFADDETSERFLGRIIASSDPDLDGVPLDGPDARANISDNFMDYYHFYPYEQIEFSDFLRDF